ncbi:hypothetical protein HX847_04880 [Marine Group I thaumarchaeote]|uniref:Uncharacterized protein n=2 Tax=Marine Group I thaumarchaeote TaxID=2511932 RepID=A0A7K4NXF6_9ARCH|nr:hypothetical protein [Candidatus Nitrosopumilus sp. MTA1]NWJ57681.1 hypothetical protein [Marine Group I thaumarchaeote]NWJ84264.1 hypothetical protein [Marine Group I thaumarchaeote]NWK07729.1 hypothetical protein [Marine Group I thaumarchaeote]NWK13825.1 hypothetical protein [Marine Group I thaumarchaeote]
MENFGDMNVTDVMKFGILGMNLLEPVQTLNADLLFGIKNVCVIEINSVIIIALAYFSSI